MKMPERNNRVWKWISAVLGVLVAAVILAAVDAALDTIRQLQELETRQELMGETVAAHKKWISDWYNVLNVPERDRGQDDAIKELRRRVEVLERKR